MANTFDLYQSARTPLPEKTWAWNMYGAGVDNIGRDEQPELFEIPEPADDQLLVRVDAVGLCFSDVKLIKQGGNHPKLYGRDMSVEPTRLGHEATVTVIKVGKDLAGGYHVGQRLAIQPDIYVDGRSTAYGYTIPGGLIQYHVMGPEVLDADDGAYVIPVPDGLGYAEAGLTEPWACVEAAYTQRRRLTPLAGGTMWIVGRPGDETDYLFSKGLEAPATIVITDVAAGLRDRIDQETSRGAEIIVRDGLTRDEYAVLSEELTDGGFDDIVLLDPRSAEQVATIATLIGFRGTLNLVGTEPLDGIPDIDAGRIHYHYTTYIGNQGPDIAASYGEERNRADLLPGGVAVFVGAGGPMGQMHIQRALELPNGPRLVIGSDLDEKRLDALVELLAPLARERGTELIAFNEATADVSLEELVRDNTAGLGADDVIVSVPVGQVMADAARLMGPNGMLVLFAGVANGTMAPFDLTNVYLHNAQYTGTSGSRIADQAIVIDKAKLGELSPNRSLAAFGGIEAARDGVQAMLDGRFAGKIMIFPQLTGLPLVGLEELPERYPDIAVKLGDGGMWTAEAEAALIERFWNHP